MTKKSDRIYIRFDPSEKSLVEEKSKQYNFTNVSEYIRWCSLNERLLVEDLVGKQEVFDKTGVLYLKVKEFVSNQKYSLKYSLASDKEVRIVKEQNEDILKELNAIRKAVVKSLKPQITKVDMIQQEEETNANNE